MSDDPISMNDISDDELKAYVRANIKTLMGERPAFLVALILALLDRWEKAKT